MMHEVKQLRRILREDGLELRPFVLMGFALIWVAPELGYEYVLKEYAAFEGDAPERVHSDLCRRLLAVGKELGPAAYFRLVQGRVEDENRISAEQGS